MKKSFICIALLIFTLFYSCNKPIGVFNTNVKQEGLITNNLEEKKAEEDTYVIPLRRSFGKPIIKEAVKDAKLAENKDKEVKTQNLRVDYKQKAIVLTYHHISNNPFSGITITPERFEKDLIMLKENGFNIISLREMLNSLEGKTALPANCVVITFDDGIESFYNYAYPLLKKYSLPATQFIITSRTESYRPSTAELNSLSQAQIIEMHDSGLVDIQSHTHKGHEYIYINENKKAGPALTYKYYNTTTNILETEEEYFKRISDDLIESRNVIYKYIGEYPDMLCFPFGSYNEKLVEAARGAGFTYFITTKYGYNVENSNTSFIYRLRAGEAKLDSKLLLLNIIECANR